MSIESALQTISRGMIVHAIPPRDKDFQEALDRIEAALNRTCKWTPLDEEDCPGAYETECGEAWQFETGWLANNKSTKFCPFCGGRIGEVPRLPDAEKDK